MLGDPELDQTVAQLAQVRQDQAKQHQTLTEVLEKYGALVEDYRRLKSDFEEERDTRERYKQLAKGSERNPFVLVLVDGDGYIFDDNILLSKEDGGQRAAQLLDDAVKASLRQKGLYNCKVMVRIYANLAGLSKALARAKLSGSNPRSIATFVANFNRSNDLFDFVDAGELKENADFKLRSMWRLFVENSQCKHIYFAGCHDVGYINELTPYQSSRDKITLIRTLLSIRSSISSECMWRIFLVSSGRHHWIRPISTLRHPRTSLRKSQRKLKHPRYHPRRAAITAALPRSATSTKKASARMGKAARTYMSRRQTAMPNLLRLQELQPTLLPTIGDILRAHPTPSSPQTLTVILCAAHPHRCRPLRPRPITGTICRDLSRSHRVP